MGHSPNCLCHRSYAPLCWDSKTVGAGVPLALARLSRRVTTHLVCTCAAKYFDDKGIVKDTRAHACAPTHVPGNTLLLGIRNLRTNISTTGWPNNKARLFHTLVQKTQNEGVEQTNRCENCTYNKCASYERRVHCTARASPSLLESRPSACLAQDHPSAFACLR